jgi:hypothetical protein
MVFRLGFLLLFEPVLFQTRQRRRAWIGCVTFTAAFLVIQIHSTLGTKPAAIAAADCLHRQSQEDLFSQNVGQEHALALKERDFGIVELQTLLFFLGDGKKRLIKEVKFARNILMHGFQATGANHLQPRVQLAGNSDLPFDEFGRRAHFERLRLPEVAGAVIDRARGIALPDTDFSNCQLFDV